MLVLGIFYELKFNNYFTLYVILTFFKFYFINFDLFILLDVILILKMIKSVIEASIG